MAEHVATRLEILARQAVAQEAVGDLAGLRCTLAESARLTHRLVDCLAAQRAALV